MQTSSVLRSPKSLSQASGSDSSSSAKPLGHWSRGIAAHQGAPGDTVNLVPARAVFACCWSRVASQAYPFNRKRLSRAPGRGRLPSAAARRSGWNGHLAR
eukprot:2163718-Prymnesium_polylepis.2